MRKRLTKFISVALASAMTLSLIVTGGSSGIGTVNAASVPQEQDSASSINYKKVLGGGVDYGIIADSITQNSHMETTFATNKYINTTGANNDVDYISSTALFLIGELDNGSKINWGKSTASAMYLEAPADVFGDSYDPDYNVPAQGGHNGNITFGNEFGQSPVPVIQAVNEQASSNVNRLISRINQKTGPVEDADKAWSYFLQERANDPKYVLNPDGDNCEYIKVVGDKLHIDVDTPDFKGKVVYVNVTTKMLNYLSNNGAFIIDKDPSTVVVCNI